MALRRFWITFEDGAKDLPLGFGVTAFDEKDAMEIVEGWLTENKFVVPTRQCILHDVDVSSLQGWRICRSLTSVSLPTAACGIRDATSDPNIRCTERSAADSKVNSRSGTHAGTVL